MALGEVDYGLFGLVGVEACVLGNNGSRVPVVLRVGDVDMKSASQMLGGIPELFLDQVGMIALLVIRMVGIEKTGMSQKRFFG